jgi:hypothetical protein
MTRQSGARSKAVEIGEGFPEGDGSEEEILDMTGGVMP